MKPEKLFILVRSDIPIPDQYKADGDNPYGSAIPANDMTAREFFCGEGGAITLDFLNEGEREFLLNAIELYASGKVKQASSLPANVGIDFEKLETLAWQVEKGQISADALVEGVKLRVGKIFKT